MLRDFKKKGKKNALGRRQTLSRTLSLNGTVAGVLAAHRFADEPCVNGCVDNSKAFRLVSALGGTVKNFVGELASVADAATRVQDMARAFVAIDDGNGAGVYVAKNGPSREFVAVRLFSFFSLLLFFFSRLRSVPTANPPRPARPV